jgi:rRNA-processing protein FCF1
MTDAHLSGLSKELKAKGIDCETVHKLILNSERSQDMIKDPKILEFLRAQNKRITLITLDTELSEYCRLDGIPCIRVQDLVADHVKTTERLGSSEGHRKSFL